MINAGSFDDLEALFYSITSDEVDVECLLFLHHVGLLGAEKHTVVDSRVLPVIHEAAHVVGLVALAGLTIAAAHCKIRTHIFCGGDVLYPGFSVF